MHCQHQPRRGRPVASSFCEIALAIRIIDLAAERILLLAASHPLTSTEIPRCLSSQEQNAQVVEKPFLPKCRQVDKCMQVL